MSSLQQHLPLCCTLHFRCQFNDDVRVLTSHHSGRQETRSSVSDWLRFFPEVTRTQQEVTQQKESDWLQCGSAISFYRTEGPVSCVGLNKEDRMMSVWLNRREGERKNAWPKSECVNRLNGFPHRNTVSLSKLNRTSREENRHVIQRQLENNGIYLETEWHWSIKRPNRKKRG